MDLGYFEKIVKIFDDSKAEELELEEEGLSIRLSKKSEMQNQVQMMGMPQNYFTPNYAPQAQMNPVVQQAPATIEAVAAPVAPAAEKFHEVKSPIVGTFYRSPSPDSDSFVEVGSRVSKGDTLCIVEAMKLMNEIESDVSGTIMKIVPNNAEAIEYNQVLFLVKAD